jgi:hypothetical protein
MAATTTDQLVALLEAAFPSDTVPAAERIADRAGAVGDERTQVVDDYAGMRWTDISSEVLGFNAEALFFMTDEAFVYYLPAFIRKYLRDRKAADLIPQNVLGLLTPGGNDRWFRALATCLSTPQKLFIAKFLEYVRDEHAYYSSEAEAALASYWRQPTEGTNDRG